MNRVRDQLLWLPPLREQNRIVAKIEELFSELDKGVESLKAARAKLDVYRQAVLKHAFEGKLTAEWRAENKDRLEPPEQLLARIQQERVARYERQLKEREASVGESGSHGKRGRKPRKPPSPKLTPENPTAESNELPFGWASATIGSMFEVVSGGTPKGVTQVRGGDIPYYKVGRT